MSLGTIVLHAVMLVFMMYLLSDKDLDKTQRVVCIILVGLYFLLHIVGVLG